MLICLKACALSILVRCSTRREREPNLHCWWWPQRPAQTRQVWPTKEDASDLMRRVLTSNYLLNSASQVSDWMNILFTEPGKQSVSRKIAALHSNLEPERIENRFWMSNMVQHFLGIFKLTQTEWLRFVPFNAVRSCKETFREWVSTASSN